MCIQLRHGYRERVYNSAVYDPQSSILTGLSELLWAQISNGQNQ